ncbi:UrcA family protein [Novosphingobium sp. FKTRR1]|uniref:UrcA family protein n=1 Tax=Novosphingobium sp. FKTRR1 TaxID=2879118 RepID=UPI001CF0356C|nr:UrcA family protein [Novosphingobium sp. FKTRR1]
MNRIALAAVCLALFPGAAFAQSPKSADAQIAVVGNGHQDGRTVVYGPDRQGRYSTKVSFTDLDLTTAGGRSAAEHRVAWAASQLCSVTGDEGDLPGFYNAGARKCESHVRDQADTVLNKAGAERPLAMLRLVAPAR